MSEIMAGPGTEPQQRLLAAGVRPTVARIGVLQILETEAPRRLTMDTVFHHLLDQGLGLKHATVYRALRMLVDHGLLSREWRNGISGAKALYGLMTPDAGSCGVEIRCKECGHAVNINDISLHEQLRSLVRDGGLELAAQPMTILGRCIRCEQCSSSTSLPRSR